MAPDTSGDGAGMAGAVAGVTWLPAPRVVGLANWVAVLLVFGFRTDSTLDVSSVQWRHKNIKVLKRPFMGEFLLIHWWPHKGSVMRKALPCHYVFITHSDPVPAYVTDWMLFFARWFFLRKKIILFHSYLEMRQDGDTPTTLIQYCFEY